MYICTNDIRNQFTCICMLIFVYVTLYSIYNNFFLKIYMFMYVKWQHTNMCMNINTCVNTYLAIFQMYVISACIIYDCVDKYVYNYKYKCILTFYKINFKWKKKQRRTFLNYLFFDVSLLSWMFKFLKNNLHNKHWFCLIFVF